VAAGVWGAALLVRAHTFAGPAPVAVALVRLLGARYVAQAVLLTLAEAPLERAVRAVDILHALSMLALVGSRRYRRPALISAAVAVGLASLVTPGSRSMSQR
jgi:hypothetical protein